MTYSEKLQKEEWKIKRSWIIKRDGYKCTKCGKDGREVMFEFVDILNKEKIEQIEKPFIFISEEELSLNVHHVCYRKGKEPWEYKDDELITLCPECHKKTHEEGDVPVYDENSRFLTYANICGRCSGYGFIPKYSHVESGICFKCWGEGVSLYNIS